eukprot:1157458-Pelagomonas_calceolata.AAC.9
MQTDLGRAHATQAGTVPQAQLLHQQQLIGPECVRACLRARPDFSGPAAQLPRHLRTCTALARFRWHYALLKTPSLPLPSTAHRPLPGLASGGTPVVCWMSQKKTREASPCQ